MTITGINIQKEDGYVLCCIDDFSDQLKAMIKAELNHICHGKAQVDEDTKSFFSYENTLKVFMERYSEKDANTKKGMMGELIAHLIIDKVLDLQRIGIFFNKEEGSIKKGFDLTYVNVGGTAVWYGEVKAGEISGSTKPNAKNSQLLGKASGGMETNLSGQRPTLWHSVITDAALSFASEKKITVQNLLKDDIQDITANPTTAKKNAILVSVLFHDVRNKVEISSIKKYLSTVKSKDVFSDVVLFSIQKSTYSRIEEFLKSEIGS